MFTQKVAYATNNIIIFVMDFSLYVMEGMEGKQLKHTELRNNKYVMRMLAYTIERKINIYYACQSSAYLDTLF